MLEEQAAEGMHTDVLPFNQQRRSRSLRTIPMLVLCAGQGDRFFTRGDVIS